MGLVAFSSTEAAKIQKALLTAEPPFSCPRCGRSLTMVPPPADVGSSTAFWEVQCLPCGRSQALGNLVGAD